MGCTSSHNFPNNLPQPLPIDDLHPSLDSNQSVNETVESFDPFAGNSVTEENSSHIHLIDCPLPHLDRNEFLVLYELGEGRTGKIFYGQRMLGEQTSSVAFKFFGYTEDEPCPHQIQQEIEIMANYCHLDPIPDIYGYFYDTPSGLVDGKVSQHVFPVIVMQLIDGCDLYEASYVHHLITSERSLAQLFHSIFKALQSLHDNRLIHRDIKLENIMTLDRRTETSGVIKIIDFGSMVKLLPEESVYRDDAVVGTLGYLAPESYQYFDYSPKSDIWQAGCCLYSLLSGTMPFRSGESHFRYAPMTGPAWEGVSSHAKELIRLLLDRNPSSRPTIAEILEHPWMTTESHDEPFSESYFSRVKYLALRQKMKRFFLDSNILEKGRERRKKLKKIIPLLRQISSISGSDSMTSHSPKESNGNPRMFFGSSSPKGGNSVPPFSIPITSPQTLDIDITPEALQQRLSKFKLTVLKSLQLTDDQSLSNTPRTLYSNLMADSSNFSDPQQSPISPQQSHVSHGNLNFETFSKLMIESDLPALASHRVFRIFDIDDKGVIHMKDFLLTMAAFYPSQSHGTFRSHWNYKTENSNEVLNCTSTSSCEGENEEMLPDDFTESIARYYFDIFDLTNSGYLDLDQLKHSVGCFIDYDLSSPLNTPERHLEIYDSAWKSRSSSDLIGVQEMDIETLFTQIDTERKGKINFEQFLKYFKKLRRNLR
jgi:serine/threonine protein kinase/Ca2+-binding EF-hand superfamily protein